MALRRSGNQEAFIDPHSSQDNVDLEIAVSSALSKESYESSKAAVKYNVQQMFRSSVTNGDAFYFPQRMITALVMSTGSLVISCVFLYRYAESYRNTVRSPLCTEL